MAKVVHKLAYTYRVDSLQEILSQKSFAVPDEMATIKAYVKKRWQADCSVQIERDKVILKVPSSALAASIQMEKHQLIQACNLGSKTLVIRTGR